MKIALVGNQNSGKSTLFNALTDMNVKIGNWPGVTVEKKLGIIKGTNYEIVDLPGIYSINPYSIEEEVSRKFLLEEKPDVIINIVDSTVLERSLYLTMQLLALDTNVIVALNMMDMLEKKGIMIDEKELGKNLGVDVVKVSALKEEGIEELVTILNNNAKNKVMNHHMFKATNGEEKKLRNHTSDMDKTDARKNCIAKMNENTNFAMKKYHVDIEEATAMRQIPVY